MPNVGTTLPGVRETTRRWGKRAGVRKTLESPGQVAESARFLPTPRHSLPGMARAKSSSEPVNLSAGTRLIPFSSPVGYRAGRHVRRGERDARGIELWPVREPAGAGADGAARGGATAAQGRAAAGQPAAGQSGGSAAGGSPGALRLGVRRAAGAVGAVWRDQGGRGPPRSSAGRPARPDGTLALRHGGGRRQRPRTGPA